MIIIFLIISISIFLPNLLLATILGPPATQPPPNAEELLDFKDDDELWRPSFTGEGPFAIRHGPYFYELHPPPYRN